MGNRSKLTGRLKSTKPGPMNLSLKKTLKTLKFKRETRESPICKMNFKLTTKRQRPFLTSFKDARGKIPSGRKDMHKWKNKKMKESSFFNLNSIEEWEAPMLMTAVLDFRFRTSEFNFSPSFFFFFFNFQTIYIYRSIIQKRFMKTKT
jgi:hypothetical protein